LILGLTTLPFYQYPKEKVEEENSNHGLP